MTFNRLAVGMAEICALAPVIPVVTIDRLDQAAPLARALVAGGLRVIEVTLRTDAALAAIEAMRAAAPAAIVGAGTLRSAEDLEAARAAGAAFGVSPGAPDGLIPAVEAAGLPFLPGCATPTEALRLAERGFEVLKLFPAESVGGVALLRSLAAPLAGLSFCPTGGISEANAPDYLALPNVACVGGSWLSPAESMAAGAWDAIADSARRAAALRTARWGARRLSAT